MAEKADDKLQGPERQETNLPQPNARQPTASRSAASAGLADSILKLAFALFAIVGWVLAFIGFTNYQEMKQAIRESIDTEVAVQIANHKIPQLYDQAVLDALYLSVARQKSFPTGSASDLPFLRFQVRQQLPRLVRIISDPTTTQETFNAALNLSAFAQDDNLLRVLGPQLERLAEAAAEDCAWVLRDPAKRAQLIRFLANSQYDRCAPLVRTLLKDESAGLEVRTSAILYAKSIGDPYAVELLMDLSESDSALASESRIALAAIDPANEELLRWVELIEKNPGPTRLQHSLVLAAELVNRPMGRSDAVALAARILRTAVDFGCLFELHATRGPGSDDWDPELSFKLKKDSTWRYMIPLQAVFGAGESAVAQVIHEEVSANDVSGLAQVLLAFGAKPQDEGYMDVGLFLDGNGAVRLHDGRTLTPNSVKGKVVLSIDESREAPLVVAHWESQDGTRDAGLVQTFTSMDNTRYALARVVVEETPIGPIRTRVIDAGPSPTGSFIDGDAPRDPLENWGK